MKDEPKAILHRNNNGSGYSVALVGEEAFDVAREIIGGDMNEKRFNIGKVLAEDWVNRINQRLSERKK